MSKAIEAFKQHITEVATLGEQVNQINARIRQIQSIAHEATAPIQQAAELKAKRRSILGRFFLGSGDKSDLPETEKAIAHAEAAAKGNEPTREGAEAAIEELQRQAAVIGFQINEIARDHDTTRHAALVEHAKAALPAYKEAEANLAQAYAELIGRCRAADDMALFQNGLACTALSFPNAIEVPYAPTFGDELYKTLIDVRNEVDKARGEAKRHLDQIARDAASQAANNPRIS